jgi:pyruvate formate lyase activating enzyme
MNAPISPKPGQAPAIPASPTTELRIGGFVGLSGCDWPGELAATVFCQGCPWQCRYCHNTHLLPADRAGQIAWSSVLDFMRSRVGLLDGLVFSGGEPTLQQGLAAAMRDVRALGFRVGLHTAGPYPERLTAVLPLVDWVGFDAKAPFDDYPRVTGVTGSGERARDSLLRVLASGVAYEVRTTVHPTLLDQTMLHKLAGTLTDLGVRRYALQAFRGTGCQDGELLSGATAPAPGLPETMRARFADMIIR